MDHSRTQRFSKPYYRNNFMPPSTRQALEDRLHPPGISTSSNSSWTFSNSHCDVPKPRKGRLCGIFLIGAVLIVALAVMAIAGLAFYIGGYSSEKNHVRDYQTKEYVGAKRQYSSKLSDTVDKTVSRYASKKPSTTTTAPISSTDSSQTKSIPEGAILGISETMQQLNKGLKNKKKEEGGTPTTTTTTTTTTASTTTSEETTETLYVDSTDYIPEEHGLSVTENIEIVPKNSSQKTSDVSSGPFNTEANYEVVKNGHARPTNEVTVTSIKTSSEPTVIVFPPKRDYSDEPWRPIIPSYRDTIRIRNPYQEEHQDKVFEHRYGPVVETPMEDDSPITFSRESYEQNLRITPEYAGNSDKFQYQNNPNSRISEEIAIKYKNLVKDHKTGNVGINHEVIVTSDDIITAPPRKPADVIIISEHTTSSTLSARYNTTEDTKIKDDVSKNGEYPIGVDQIISGISVVESSVETSTKTVIPTTEVKTTQKPQSDKTTANIKTTLRMETTTTARTVTVAKPSSPKTTPKAETTAYSEFSKPTVKSKPAEVTTGTAPKTSQTVITTEVTTTSQFSNSPVNESKTTSAVTSTNLQENTTIKNPFFDDSRSSSSSSFNFGIPDLPILKQFHHLDSLLKSFTKSSGETSPPLSKYFVRSDDGNETTVTRFPVRTKQTTAKNYKKDDTVFVEVSTISPESSTKATTKPVTRKPIVIKGEVEVVSGPIKQEPTGATTELPKLITLLPVRSNVNMMRPLRPRPKSNINSTITITDRRKGKMSSGFVNTKDFPANETKSSPSYPQHHFVNDKNGKRWVYYSSSKLDVSQPVKNEKLFIVTPEPKIKVNELLQDDKFFNFPKNLTDVPLYNTIETLLNLDYRNREGNVNSSTLDLEPEKEKSKTNTSELVEKIVKIVENVAITTGDSTDVIVKVNQTMVNKTTEVVDGKKDAVSVSSSSRNATEPGIATKTFSSHYKLNQAGVPVLTKILNKAPAFKKEEEEERISDVTPLYESKGCDTNSIKCGNGTCLPASKKCNQYVDCPDAADEKNCTCAEHLMAQQLHRKLCDGVVDCWDFTDEFNCDWCHEEFLCSNSRMCIKKSQICDGTNNCPFGDDERNCVTVSPSKTEAETFSYHHNGYLMVRKNGQWGKLCIDNFDSVSLKSKTGWKISDLGRSVCKALTFKDFDKVERMISVPNEGRSVGSSEGEKYYELAYNEVSSTQHSPRDSVLSFHETECAKKEVVKVTCTDLECGLRPQATNQRSRKSLFGRSIDELSYNSSRHSRIVGGGNAGPGSWPWQAALYKEGEFQCGGTLISENWLISAGHCFYHNQDAFWVARLGTLRTTLLLPSPYEQLRQISKIILHPQYIDNGFINDISLLRMRDSVRFTDYVRPICLPKPDATIVDGTMCTVVGWGQLSEVGWVFPDTLQEVQLPILSSSECRKRTLFLPLYKITDDMFCAGYERGGRDACLGDSGGPLMCPEPDGKWSLFGVTSNGYGCARSNRPGVYTKVSKYLHWIQFQMTLHSETLGPVNDNEETVNPSTSRNFTDNESANQKTEHVIKLISQRVSNVKLSTDYLKSGDKCKGHRCPLGECLLKSQLCNGHIECSDGSDEKDCW